MSEGVISRPVKVFFKLLILTKLLLALKRPKLGIQLPNAGDNNESYYILTVIFNQIKQLHIMWRVCVFWPPLSIPCPNCEAVGFQPQAVDMPKPRLCASSQFMFKPHYAKDACQLLDKTNKGIM